ncbi:MAG TPA: iron-containing alcohol dehydrogenase, partial [Miltoncostaeaceae bacterium]|nr:iron-containing alcohol dehydrogenase [Miltoncostaeaceae bacterium]
VWDPSLLDTLGAPGRAASAMNALGHAAEAPLTPHASPLARLAADAAVAHLERGLGDGPVDDLALGAMLAGYAIGTAGYGLHHVLAQTVARECGAGHGAANTVMLPHALGALVRRFPGRADPDGRIARLADAGAAAAGVERLRDLGVTRDDLDHLATVAAARAELHETPPPASREELHALYAAAW